MWILALLLLVQNPNQVPPPANPLAGTFRINGRILVDRGEIPLVEVRLLNNNGTLAKTALSFANGTFHFNEVSLGRYTVEVIDSRYNLATVQLWYRDPAETSGVVTVRLVSNGKADTSLEMAELDKTVRELELDATIPASALVEFKKGVEAIRYRSKDNPPEVHFKKAVQLAPDFYEAHYQIGLESARQRRTPQAIPALERAVSLKPAAPMPLSLLGRLYVEAGRFQDGIATLLKIASLRPLSADDRYFLGLAFYNSNRMDAAQQQLELAISLAPNKNPGAYVHLSNAYLKNGQPEAALAALENYLRLFPKDQNYDAVQEGTKKLRVAIQKAKP